MIFKIHNDKIVIENSGKSDSKDFKSKLPADDCRYGVFDHSSDGKIYFIMWCPESSPVRQRMVYASSKDAIAIKLDGYSAAVQAHEMADLDKIN